MGGPMIDDIPGFESFGPSQVLTSLGYGDFPGGQKTRS